MISSAVISPDEIYRYTLERCWRIQGPTLCLAMLNPSKADARLNDPTIRRGIGLAQRWGYGGIVVINLFAYRATDPKEMKLAVDPVGPENDRYILEVLQRPGLGLLVAWGAHGGYLDRDTKMMELIKHSGQEAYHLGLTKEGYPRHPLYVPSNVRLERYYGRN